MSTAPDRKPRRSALPSLSISRPIGTIMATSVILVIGVFYLSRLPLDLLPTIVYPNVRVNLNNNGVEPEVLEETVAKPLEAALATTENLERIETEIQEGRVGINLHFKYGTNIDFALQDAAKNLERARGRLPEEADPATINKSDPSQIPIYEVAFSSSSRDLISLRDWVEYRLRPQLLTISGVASVDVSGGLVREIQVVLDQERLRSYGLTVSQVIEAIRTTNQDVAAGRVASSTREVAGKTQGKLDGVDELRSILLSVPGGGRIPLAEVADVRDTHQDQRMWVRLDGVPAVRLSIRKQPDANTVAVADGADERLASLRESNFIPANIQYEVTQNQADFIRGSVASVRDAAITGGFLAMMVVLLFLGSLRKTFVIGTSIPIAILGTFMLMGMGKLTLNIMSLGGLALGIGMLIDSSIVMLENIFRHTEEQHEDPVEAAHHGAAEVEAPLVAATATNLAAVVPFLLISGLAAMLFKELILTISFAILGALFVALTIVPMLAAQMAKVRFTSGLSRSLPIRAIDRFMDGLRSGYRRIGPTALRLRYPLIALSVAGLFGVTRLIGGLGSEFLPQVDDGKVGVMLMLAPGTSAEQTNQVSLQVEEMVRQMPYVKHTFSVAGGMAFGGAQAARAGRGSIDVILAPAPERPDMPAAEWVQELQRRINERGFPGARVFVRPPQIRGLRTNTAGSPIALVVQGDDLLELQRISDEIMDRIRGVPGLEGAQPSADEATQQLSVELDRERASYLGLNVAMVGSTLRTALDGTIASQYTDANKEYDIRVMFPRERFQSPEDLGSIALFPGQGGGAPIYLRDVANVSSVLAPSTIRRENQNRTVRITGDVNKAVSTVGQVNNEIRARIADLELPEGYGILFGGEEESMRDNNRQLTTVALLAIFLVFVVMAVQYESLLNPLVIITTIPFSLIGVGVALRATSTPLSAPVMLGVILLAGIVVNNAILLVEYVEQFRKEAGATMHEAVVEAGAVRMRPILMTTLCTMLGMLPLAMGIGEGSEMMQPLAISVVGGMAVSTLMTLFVVPGVYVIFHTVGDRLKAFLVGGAKAPEPAPVAVGAATPAEAVSGD